MGYKLEQPYSDIDRADFIVKHNHEQGLQIEETENAIYALEPWEKLEGDNIYDNSTEYEAEQAEKRQEDFKNNFIITSWGAFRKNPKGYSSAVEAVNTVFNMVNVAQSFTEQLANLLIFYETPDFTNAEQCTEEWLVAHQKTHESCDLQTFMQWYLEFQTVWAQTQYTDAPITEMKL